MAFEVGCLVQYYMDNSISTSISTLRRDCLLGIPTEVHPFLTYYMHSFSEGLKHLPHLSCTFIYCYTISNIFLVQMSSIDLLSNHLPGGKTMKSQIAPHTEFLFP
jgi:hypothetical protein